MVNFDLILVFVVIIFILVSLYREILGPAFTFLIAVLVLGVFGVLTPSEILKGFANEQVAVVLLLLVVGEIIRRTQIMELIFDRFFKSAKNYRGFLSRMVILISCFSAFLNNTPLVAVMIPYVHAWCKKNNISPSKFMMPLSYAAILGGCATLIGTSTNMIVNGLVVDQTISSDLQPLGIFDFAAVGVPMIVIGIFYMLFLGDKLLKSKPDVITQFSTETREYLIEAKIPEKSHFIGKTVEESGLKKQQGIDLVEIWRRGLKIKEYGPELLLDRGDVLIFAGDPDVIADLIHNLSGITVPEVGMYARKKRSEIIEVVVSQNSGVINRTVREANFRSKYDAAIISVHRNGEHIRGKIGEVELKAGDVLLLYAGGDFVARTINTTEFYFISKVREIIKYDWYKTYTMLGGLLLAIVLSAFQLVPLFISLLVLVVISLAFQLVAPKELPRSIDFNLGIIIVLSLALGTAMIKSGAADMIAQGIISVFMPLGKIGLLVGIFIITSILAAYITSKAAAAIIFPISLTTAVNLDLNPIPFVLIVAYAAAANFMTPIGFQTNLMVYGPGGYSFRDFFRVGAPLTIIYMVVTVIILSVIYL
ncbi:MAG: SLC13 family permease [Bacteroidales bacterium]|nr:SLC13 family permease [Bacteroidales bacterium]